MGLHPTPYPYTSLHQCCSARRSNCHSMPTRTTSSLLVPAGGTAYLLGHERSCHATAFAGSIRTQPIAPENAAHHARGDLAHLQLRGPHDLRHSFSTWLEDEGIPARVIDELIGHQRSRRGGAGRWQPHRRPLSAHHPRDGCPDRPSGRPPVGARPPDRASDHPQRNWTRAIGSSSEAEVHTGRGNRWLARYRL
jgi:Phage integrase family